MIQGKSSAPAKVILFGEHFVVYDNPAILASINKRVYVSAACTSIDGEDNRVSIRSNIGAAGRYNNDGEFHMLEGGAKAKSVLDPLYIAIRQVLLIRNKEIGIEIDIYSEVIPGIGLGSSAASCVATVAAVDSLFCKKPSKQKICELAIESEKMIHKRTSGADCYVSTFGGLIEYHHKSRGFKKLETKGSLSLVVASTGVKHSTADLVAAVKRFKDRNQILFESLAKQSGDICLQACTALSSCKIDKIGELMNENQTILQQIGVSHPKVEDLIDICSQAGAIGAKLTGAGGGGAVIALAATKHDSTKIASHIKAAGYQSFEVEIDHKGLSFY